MRRKPWAWVRFLPALDTGQLVGRERRLAERIEVAVELLAPMRAAA